ncbi:MAG: L,D-transpeptidase family protein [Myxococcota bacterium]|nr:L,D-transpeptidase family protein [Myxococcota bacterium]
MLLLLACLQTATSSSPQAPDGPTAAVPVEPTVEPARGQPCPPSTAALVAQHPEQLDAADPRLQGSDLVVVRKSVRRVMRYDQGRLAAGSCWQTGLGFAPEGHKQREGDGRTPEGFYTTSDKPWSQFYGAIAVHYPSADDAEIAHADGRISAATKQSIHASLQRGEKPNQNTAMGGEILLHGGGGSSDWTLGCVALDNQDLDTLRAALPPGMKTTVLILR